MFRAYFTDAGSKTIATLKPNRVLRISKIIVVNDNTVPATVELMDVRRYADNTSGSVVLFSVRVDASSEKSYDDLTVDVLDTLVVSSDTGNVTVYIE